MAALCAPAGACQLGVPAWGAGVAVGGGLYILFLPVAKLCAAGAWRFSRMWQELLTNTCFPAPSPGMPRGPCGGCGAGGRGMAGMPPPRVPRPSQGSPAPGLSCPLAAAGGIWASLFLSEVWPLHRAAKTCPCPGEGAPPPPSRSCLSLGCSAACPARAGAQEGPCGVRLGGGGHSAGAHAHTACDPRPFFINEKNVQGLNDCQEQIYSSSPEIKLK